MLPVFRSICKVHLEQQFNIIASPERFLAIQALGILAAARGEYRRAAILLGAVDQRFNWLKNVSCPVERDEYEQALAVIQTSLGEEAFAAAWTEGQAL